MDDLKQYGLDAEDELLSILSEELAKSIDREILRSLGFETDKKKRRIKRIDKLRL